MTDKITTLNSCQKKQKKNKERKKFPKASLVPVYAPRNTTGQHDTEDIINNSNWKIKDKTFLENSLNQNTKKMSVPCDNFFSKMLLLPLVEDHEKTMEPTLRQFFKSRSCKECALRMSAVVF